MNWTKEQSQAIYQKGSNILVAAAAGSGKTAVLVERIINKIIREKIDIDKILVVTFTKAAASEMRGRILYAIYKEIEKAKNELKELQNEDLEMKQEKLKQTIDYFNQIIDSDEPAKAILNMLIDKIYIYHDKSVQFELKIKIEKLFE